MVQVTLGNGRCFQAAADKTILDAAGDAGVVLEHSCRTGRCGTCKARVVGGSTNALLAETSLDDADRALGWVLTCARAPASDVTLDIEDLSGLAGIQQRTLPCRVDALERRGDDVMLVTLRLPPDSSFRFRAGQYVNLIGPDGFTRSYSIGSDPAQDKLQLHIREVPGGALSRYWFDAAKHNDLLRFRGPIGTFFLRDVAGLDIVFLATGTGFAPVQSMLGELAAMPADKRPASLKLYWGGRHRNDLYLDPSGLNEGLEFHPVLSRAGSDWSGACGHVQDVLVAHAPDLSRLMVYACGSEAMIKTASTLLLQMGLPPKRFLSDAFVSSS